MNAFSREVCRIIFQNCFFLLQIILGQECSKLTVKTPERHHWRRSGVFIVNFQHISHLVLMILLSTLSK